MRAHADTPGRLAGGLLHFQMLIELSRPPPERSDAILFKTP